MKKHYLHTNSLFESGRVIIGDKESDKIIIAKTIKCVHCNKHWISWPGRGRALGKQIGFCQKCNGYICGKDCSGKCVPIEQMLENIEKGKALDYTPIIVRARL